MSLRDKHTEAFLDEANELLAELETALLELEQTPDNTELIGRVFRAMHTIKGSGAMFGFDDVAAFTHEMETVFDLVRNGRITVTKQLIDMTLAARDQIRCMLNPSEGNHVDVVRAGELVEQFRRMLPRASGTTEMPETPISPQPAPEKDLGEVTYRIRFRPPGNLFMNGTNPLGLLNELREIGNCRIIAQTDAIPLLPDIDPLKCYTYWDIILTTNRGVNAIRDVFIFVEDGSELTIDVIDEGGDPENETAHKKLGEILMERKDVNSRDLEALLASQKKIGELLVESGAVTPGHVESALVEQQHIQSLRSGRRTAETIASVRVPSDKLDRLVDLVGELVTVQARLSQAAAIEGKPYLLQISEEVERLTESLRDNTMNIRMLPIGTTFSKFKRLVRDLSVELGKEIELTTDGAETELDKTVIERLGDPLVHLIRNSVDHGIETPDVRAAAGKPAQGTVHLSAAHSGAFVVIQITDDGAGLDSEAIRAKAIENGLIPANIELSGKDLFALIFEPGFSTAKEVTGVSGRGVGMDVVKRAIDALRGTIEISSKRGAGTTFTLSLPLTLAIIEGLLVKIAEEHFVIPLSSVEECVELARNNGAQEHGRRLANVRGSVVPFILLRDLFGITTPHPPIEQIVIIESGNGRIGLVVDNVIGQQQTVIKSLGKFYRNVDCISGATILGDGTVALILDIRKIIRNVELQEQVER